MTARSSPLIPKPNKDPILIDNWRAITLLNNDYTIIDSVLVALKI